MNNHMLTTQLGMRKNTYIREPIKNNDNNITIHNPIVLLNTHYTAPPPDKDCPSLKW